MGKGSPVDTSFLITLANANRPNHAVARSYFRHSLELGLPLYLSTLVAAEFERRQPIADVGLQNFIVLPLNLPEAATAARLTNALERDDADHRGSVLVDFLLLAQAHDNGAVAILTEDRKTLAKYCNRLLEDGFDPEQLVDPPNPGLAFPVQGSE